jgi:ABC-2 type transport system permease protein
MGPTFALSLRQLASRWRLSLIVLLAGLAVALAAVVAAISDDAKVHGGTIDVFFDGLIIGAVMPIVTMALATAAFGNELEDRTLSYLVLKPTARWLIVLPKLLASIAVAGPLLIVTGVAITLLLLDGDTHASLAVGVALFTGVVTYSAIFTWAGLATRMALPFALAYVFIWEGLVSTFLGGVRYLSVRGYALAIMHGIDDESFGEFGERVIELPAAIVGAVAVTVVFFSLAVHRLRTMDVP